MCRICGLWCRERHWEDGPYLEIVDHGFGTVQRLASASLSLNAISNDFADSGMLSLGEAGELSPNASAMLRISTLSAWAQLQVSSTQQAYLENVVKPYRPTLCSLWIAALRDYASIRIDSEFLHDTSSVVDSSYSSLGKDVLLPVRAVLS